MCWGKTSRRVDICSLQGGEPALGQFFHWPQRKSRGGIGGKDKPNFPLTDPGAQQDRRFYSHHQTPTSAKYLPAPKAATYTSLPGPPPAAARISITPSDDSITLPGLHMCLLQEKIQNPPRSSPSSWPVYSLLGLSSLLWSNLVKEFIFQVPPQINGPFDQGNRTVKLRKDTFSFFWEGFGDVSHCKNLSLGMLSTSANCCCKAYAEIHLRRELCSMISSLSWKMPIRPPRLN